MGIWDIRLIIPVVVLLFKNTGERGSGRVGGGGVQMSGHLSVVSYSVHDY